MVKTKKYSILNADILLFLILGASALLHYFKLFPKEIDFWLLLTVAALATLPVLKSAGLAVKNKKITVDLLAAIALVFSMLHGDWLSAVFINMMLTSARILLGYSENRARRNVESLLKLKPQKAALKKGNEITEVLLAKIKVGDEVVVKLGERVPVDGVIVEGEASMDQSSLTGESIPVSKLKGDRVLSSSMVVSGNIIIKTEKIGKETTLEKFIALVEEAQSSKAQINTVADKFASYYITLTLLGAGVIYFFSHSWPLVLSVMLVVCADDIAIAIPLAFLTAIGYAARRGVIIKGANFLEGMAKAKIVVTDKTGTLTRGKMKVEKVGLFDGHKLNEILELGGSAAEFSDHPSAKAVLTYFKNQKLKPVSLENFEEVSGKGITASYGGKKLIMGKLSFLNELGVEIGKEELDQIQKVKTEGLNLTLLAYDQKLIGYFALADEIRPQTKEAMRELKDLGVEKIVMLTGDNETVAQRVAGLAGIQEFRANLMPEDKLNYLRRSLSPNYKTVMVGDGVNDAAALSLADIGIAMGAIGYDVAVESADVVLMKDDLSKVPELMRLSRYVLKIARENFAIWGSVNAVGLALVFGNIIHPTGAAAYNFITDFFPLFNSLRILKFYLKPLK